MAPQPLRASSARSVFGIGTVGPLVLEAAVAALDADLAVRRALRKFASSLDCRLLRVVIDVSYSLRTTISGTNYTINGTFNSDEVVISPISECATSCMDSCPNVPGSQHHCTAYGGGSCCCEYSKKPCNPCAIAIGSPVYVSVTIDSGNSVSETSETNNTFAAYFSP